MWSMIRKRQRKSGEEGFTLIELIVVVAILGFLMAIAIPRYLTARLTAAQSATKANLHSLASSLELYATENNKTTYPGITGSETAITWLKAYIAQAPHPPADNSGYYYYAPLDDNGGQTGSFTHFAIWDPNSYGGKCYAVGPAGVIGEGTVPAGGTTNDAIKEAIKAATGLSSVNIDPANPGMRQELRWP